MSDDINVGAISEALNNKVDLNQLNTNSAGLSYGSGWGMPSDNYEDLTLGATGSVYTASANGWVMFCRRSTGNNQYLNLKNATSGLFFEASAYASNNYLCSFLPVLKNDIFQANYNANGSDLIFIFIYAQGEEVV